MAVNSTDQAGGLTAKTPPTTSCWTSSPSARRRVPGGRHRRRPGSCAAGSASRPPWAGSSGTARVGRRQHAEPGSSRSSASSSTPRSASTGPVRRADAVLQGIVKALQERSGTKPRPRWGWRARWTSSSTRRAPRRRRRRSPRLPSRRGGQEAGRHLAQPLSDREDPHVAELCRGMAGITHPDTEFDAHPYLLNCENCVVDLRDGQAAPTQPRPAADPHGGRRVHPRSHLGAVGQGLKSMPAQAQPGEDMDEVIRGGPRTTCRRGSRPAWAGSPAYRRRRRLIVVSRAAARTARARSWSHHAAAGSYGDKSRTGC